MIRSKRSAGGAAGFTLIELLVVVLIIGILAALAIPQYFKVVERSRVSEAVGFISAMKASQERYMARYGTYCIANGNISLLDLEYQSCTAAPYSCGMKNFNVTLGAGAGTCSPNFSVTLMRQTAATAVSAKYGIYTLYYERCGEITTLPICPGSGNLPGCNADLNPQ